MAATTPVAIGTRGTVGSLVRKEIDYFTKFEIDRCASSRKPQGQVVDIAADSFQVSVQLWNGSSSRFFPNICLAVEVADSNRLSRIPGFSCRILKDDLKDMQDS
ncbi:Kinase superfamily protein [Salix suchowensis]|nr:Kinase superfamily protein [Salix suchowensis]